MLASSALILVTSIMRPVLSKAWKVSPQPPHLLPINDASMIQRDLINH